MGLELKNKSKLIDANWREMNIAYSKYARYFNLTITSLAILEFIYNSQPINQKSIVNSLFISKQTVSNVIAEFYKLGYIEFQEFSKDKRNKQINLTYNGSNYAQNVISGLREIESNTIKCISDSDLEICLNSIIKFRENLQIYVNYFDKKYIKEFIDAYTIE